MHFLLLYCDLILCTTPACFSMHYMVPTLVEYSKFSCVLVNNSFLEFLTTKLYLYFTTVLTKVLAICILKLCSSICIKNTMHCI